MTYPGATKKDEKEVSEAYAKINIAPAKQPYTFGAAYYADDTGGYKNNTKEVAGSYYEFNATYNFGPVQGLVSYGLYEHETETITVAASKEIAGIGFTLSYIDAQRDGTNGSYLNKDREYVTLSAKKVFQLNKIITIQYLEIASL